MPETARNITLQASNVSAATRTAMLGQYPLTLWFTGFSGSGKSTLAYALEDLLISEGRSAYVLDGDNIRHGLSRDLGFSEGDRTENLRRVAEVAKLMNDAGLIVITAFISPLRSDRSMARSIIGTRFIEVFIDAPLAVCETRDPKGLYRKARKGEIPNFTGISAPYEAPSHPDISLSTASVDAPNCAEILFKVALKYCALPK